MKLFKRSEPSPLKTNQPADFTDEDIDHCIERSKVLLNSIQTTFDFLKTFALDIEELYPDKFRNDIDQIADIFKKQNHPRHLELDFERQKDKISSFIDHQHRYLQDRETELRDIIALMSKAMANSNVENIEFYQRIYDQSDKMLEITHIDNIKKIRNTLQQQVELVRQTIKQKNEQEKSRIQYLAKQVSHLREELETAKNKSMTDGLTGIYNRQAFDDYLKDLIKHNTSMSGDFSLLLMDLDDFKLINDTYGHLIGDRVLIAFSHKCRSLIRSNDFIARYGGEEFAIILPDSNLQNANKKARLIVDTVSSTKYATSAEQTDDYLCITVSIGLSAYKKGDSPESLINRADKALYSAKKAGKNRSVVKK
ncbi:MAG: diguanylate cyclase [Desulfobacteraceae bacterium]|nr:diguanylate cyclase [Desulfobacteraceae bacterium]